MSRLPLLICLISGAWGNLAPQLTADMNGLVLNESVPVGTVIYRLEGVDPEGSQVRFHIEGSSKVEVDPETGQVTLVAPLDYETSRELKLQVTVEDVVATGGEDNNMYTENNVVTVPVSVIVTDVNDNPPFFQDNPYEVEIDEDMEPGKTIFDGVFVRDLDTVGEVLDVTCSSKSNPPETCDTFSIKAIASNESGYHGAIVLNHALDYSKRQLYQMVLLATDGEWEGRAVLEVKVRDVQNSPPVFTNTLVGVVKEDAPIGTLVLTAKAHDGDLGHPRQINYELVNNPMSYFLLDAKTGELHTAKPLDKEENEMSGTLTFQIRAYEVEGNVRVGGDDTMTTEQVTVTIKDVNDEAPRFNQREFSVEIPENFPLSTPLPRLDMTVLDRDVGVNSYFTLRLADATDLFAVEPTVVNGAASVLIRVANGSLDYENPNQRKFIIRVIAEETETNPRLSSTATVTVMVTDVNDNAPTFPLAEYSASVNEAAEGGTFITAIVAGDRDTGRFGPDSIVYSLDGNGADRFLVEKKTGTVTVADCATPGVDPCLDLETKSEYHLTYTATDAEGTGLSAQVPLRITLTDANDNAPRILHSRYRTSVEEGAKELQPPLVVSATDLDQTSEIEYRISHGNELNLFALDPHTGQITINGDALDLTNLNATTVNLVVEATDGRFVGNATVSIAIQDVNNNAPIFTMPRYVAIMHEDADVGTFVTQIAAHDGDTGANAMVRYMIQSGGFNEFNLDSASGNITLATQLDYDRRSNYSIIVLAVDGGAPPHTGTATVQVDVINSNDKAPMFHPATQRTQVLESAAVAAVVYKLEAIDSDAEMHSLRYEVTDPVTGIDSNGQAVHNPEIKEWFKVDRETGEVFVAKDLRRDIAAVVSISVIVTDSSAPNLQQGRGVLIITIIDVNDFAPTFAPPWTPDDPHYHLTVPEGWTESPIRTFTAMDKDSAIAYYKIDPPSDIFTIDNTTGVVKLMNALDYEKTSTVSFTVWAYDTGVPQLSSSALVTVSVTNINDNDPVFSQGHYKAAVEEGSPAGTLVTTVSAKDLDLGDFGVVTYSLVGTHADHFSIGAKSGEIRVLDPTILDREARTELTLEVVAQDGAPPDTRRGATAAVIVTIKDVNDNAPVFENPMYLATVMENVALDPPPPLILTKAFDPDEGENGTVEYSIIHGNIGDVFRIDPDTGIIYPAKSLRGGARKYSLIVQGRDKGNLKAQTQVQINVLDVNEHRPTFVIPSAANSTVVIPEGRAVRDHLVLTVLARDEDTEENGRVTYHFKVNNSNVQQTDEFSIDQETGELRIRVSLDREVQARYEVVLSATDHGTSIKFEAVQLLSIVLEDENDNEPEFIVSSYDFQVVENNDIGIELGRVMAIDRDEGRNARIYYSLMEGNEDHLFRLDRVTGAIYANASLDRETQDVYPLFIKASNDPDFFPTTTTKKRDVYTNPSIVRVNINVLDENDNAPSFHATDYYVGVKASSIIGEWLQKVEAFDPDLGANGTLDYLIQSSNLYKAGSQVSSGSVIPAPFNITKDGKIVTAAVMAEYTQDRFQLTVVAREQAPPHRTAQVTVHVWVYEPHQLVRVILSRPPEEVHRESADIMAELGNATQSRVVVNDVRYHVDSEKHVHRDWTDMYLHVVDPKTHAITDTMQVLKAVDSQYDLLKDKYSGFAIENILPAVEEPRPEPFDAALAALVALLIVLFVGCVTFVVVCCCLRNWALALPLPGRDDLKKKDALIKQAILEELHTTENPLWVEQKLKLYEEQELTMQVFIDELRHNDDSNSQHEDNTYATIQHPHRGGREDMGDYETLSAHRPRPSHGSDAARGFTGSSFQVPHQQDLL